MNFKQLVSVCIVGVLWFQPALFATAIDFKKPVTKLSIISLADPITESRYQRDVAQYIHERTAQIGGRLIESSLLRDIDELYLLGYFEDISVQTVPFQNGVELQFLVIPNPRLSEIQFKGNTVYTANQLIRRFYHRPGVVFNTKYFKEDLDQLKSIYQLAGYELFQIDESFLDESNRLVFRLNEGLVRSIRWEGLSTIQPFILERDFRTRTGSILNSIYLRKDREKLLKLGYFSDVSPPRLEETLDKQAVDVVFDVTETHTNRIGLGLELEQKDGDVVGFFRGDLSHSLIHSDLLSGKTQIGVEGGKVDVRTYSLRYYQPWFMNWLPVSFETNTWWTTQTERISTDLDTNFENTRIGGDVGFGLPLFHDEFRVSTRFRAELVSPNVSSDTVDLSRYGIQAFSLQLQYKGLQDPFNPKGGYQWLVEAERGVDLGLFNSSLIFSRYRLDASGFLGLSDTSVLGIHLGLGYFTTDQSITTFEQEKFEVGGATTLRGFKETDAFIGNRKFLVNLEYRWDMSDLIQWVLFYDVGKTFDAGTDISLDTMHTGQGIGIRFFTPLGPIRFDLAEGKSATTGKEDTIIHFSLGQMF